MIDDGDLSMRTVAVSLIRQRHLLQDGLVGTVDYDTTLRYLTKGSPQAALLDAVTLIAVELIDTVRECVNSFDGVTAVTTDDVLNVYLRDFGVPYA